MAQFKSAPNQFFALHKPILIHSQTQTEITGTKWLAHGQFDFYMSKERFSLKHSDFYLNKSHENGPLLTRFVLFLTLSGL